MQLEDAKKLIKEEGVRFDIVLKMVHARDHAALKEWYVREAGVPNKDARGSDNHTPLKEISGRPKERELVMSDQPCHVCGGQQFVPGPCPTCANCGESSKGCS